MPINFAILDSFMLTSILIAFGLNFDTFSVSIVEGSLMNRRSLVKSLKIACCFGFGQALMALVGSFLGSGFKSIIVNSDHWIAFILLSLIGGKMISESRNVALSAKKTNTTNIKSLFILVIATSIDALVVGITLAFIDGQIITDILFIGIITFIVSFVGHYLGSKLKGIIRENVKIAGGLILIVIGIKTLIQHLFLGS